MPVVRSSATTTSTASPAARPVPRRAPAKPKISPERGQRELLSTARLRLAPNLLESAEENGCVVIKNVPQKTYLTLTKGEWRLLQRFRTQTTVQDLLPKLITEREIPPLKELFELILKASQKGHLIVNDQAPEGQVEAIEWTFRLAPTVARGIAIVSLVVGAILLLFPGPKAPELWQWLVGPVLASVFISLGNLLAAGRVRASEGEIYDFQFYFRTLLPHYRFDLGDAVMGGRATELDCGLLRLAPLVLLAGLTTLFAPGLAFVLTLGIFFITDPFTRGPIRELLRAGLRKRTSDTQRDLLFITGRMPTLKAVQAQLNALGPTYLLGFTAFSAAWFAALLVLVVQTFGFSWRAVWLSATDPLNLVLMVLLGMLLVAFVVLRAPSLGLANTAWVVARSLAPPEEGNKREEPRFPPGDRLTRADMDRFISRMSLFRAISPQFREKVVQSLVVTNFQRKAVILNEGDPVEALCIVYEGKVEAIRKLPSGRPESLQFYTAGDTFNGVALVQRTAARRTIRALTKGTLLKLPRTVFEAFILSPIGTNRVLELIERRAFLERIELSREWEQDVMQAFAEKAVIGTPAAGETIVRSREGNRFFYIVYEGSFDVVVGGKKVAALKQGQFFGEISLLQNSVATADVVATDGARYMAVDKPTFLRVMARDPRVGLQFESIASTRLKRPIFPLAGNATFDNTSMRG